MTGQAARRSARVVLAGIWLHQGLWAKILGGDPSHEGIVGSVPGLDRATARVLTTGIGVAEVGMALWVLSGRRPRACAAAQTILMAGFNAGALAFARDRLESPRALLARNTAIATLAWLAAW